MLRWWGSPLGFWKLRWNSSRQSAAEKGMRFGSLLVVVLGSLGIVVVTHETFLRGQDINCTDKIAAGMNDMDEYASSMRWHNPCFNFIYICHICYQGDSGSRQMHKYLEKHSKVCAEPESSSSLFLVKSFPGVHGHIFASVQPGAMPWEQIWYFHSLTWWSDCPTTSFHIATNWLTS